MAKPKQRFFLDHDNNNTWYMLPVELKISWLAIVECNQKLTAKTFGKYRIEGDAINVSFTMPKILAA